ncbi:MAG: family 10 glycosylhydrolase [Rhodothermales bacterium]
MWFATVLRDGNWPVSSLDSPAKQEADLRDRIRHAHDLGLNTFVFQAVSRGDAMYSSERLPWSAQLKGAAQDPGFDPLAVAIEEAHAQGMELHAWINVHRVGDVSTVSEFSSATSPGHVYYEHPGWVQSVSGALWLDPSSVEGRQWLVENVMEIVDNYDIDAVHFDFIRYPQGGLPDDLTSFQFDPRGFSDIGDWRRDNVTQFVADVSAAVWAEHPWVKIGSAPFGNYENFGGAWPASWALTDVFQESREWLAAGTHDYLAPQIYFDIGREPEPPNTYDSPDFAFLVEDWVSNASNRPIFVGHGPYKPVVLEELNNQIDLTRTESAAGQFFFRYDHVKNFDFSLSYPAQSLPAPMRHRFEAAAPDAPSDLSASLVATTNGYRFDLSWTASAGTDVDPLRGYAVFRSASGAPSITTGDDLASFVWAGETTYSEELPSDDGYTYQVLAVSRLGLPSLPSNPALAIPVGVDAPARPVESVLTIDSIHPNPATEQITLSFRAAAGKDVNVAVVDLVGRQVISTRIGSSDNGWNAALLDVRDLPAGFYVVTLQSEFAFASAPFVIAR